MSRVASHVKRTSKGDSMLMRKALKSAPEKKRAPRSARSEARRALIVAAGLEHFMHYGIKGASLDEIAHQAGVSRPALYHHFSNKDELFRAVASSVHDSVLEKVAAVAVQPLPAGQRLHRMLEIKCSDIHETMWRSRHGSELFNESNRICVDLVRTYRRRFIRELARVLESAHEAGSVDLANLSLTPGEGGAFLFFSAEGLHERFTGSPVPPNVYRQRLHVLVESLLAAITSKGGTSAEIADSRK